LPPSPAFYCLKKTDSGNPPGNSSGKPETLSPVSAEILAGPEQLLAAYRKIIVLLADEKNLSPKEKASASQVGQSLFHENIGLLASIGGQLKL